MTFDELSKKYGIVLLSNKRFYREDLTKRDFTLENTRPEYFRIMGDEFSESSWGKLLKEAVDYLIQEYEPTRDELLSMRTEWSKQKVFRENATISAHQILDCGLYLNTNHTALHSCWLLQDLLKFFNVDLKNVELLIHRLPIAETREVKDFFINTNKENFRYFLLNIEKKSQEYYKVVENGIKYIDQFINRYFQSYESMYLIDDILIYGSIKSKLLQKMKDTTFTSEKNIQTFDKIMILYTKYLNYLK